VVRWFCWDSAWLVTASGDHIKWKTSGGMDKCHRNCDCLRVCAGVCECGGWGWGLGVAQEPNEKNAMQTQDTKKATAEEAEAEAQAEQEEDGRQWHN